MEKVEKKIPKLRFPEFHHDWDIIKLGEKTDKIGSGATPRGGSKVYTKDGVLFIRSQNVNNDQLFFEDVTYIPEEIHHKMLGSEVHASDILLNITGASIGRSCVVPNDFKKGNVNQHVCIIRLKSELSPKFYQSFLSSYRGQKLIFQSQAGGGREGLNFQSIKAFKIPLPSLPEQQKIASFLTAVDKKIQQLTRKKELLEQYKKGVMQKLFSQQIRFRDEDGNDYPEWEEKKLGEISKFLDGRRKPIKSGDRSKMQGEFPYYGASGIIDYVNSYIFDEDLILLGEDGENIISRNLPLAFRVSGKCWVNNHAHVMVPLSNYDIDFLTYSLERINYLQYNTGTAQPKLNQEVCKKIKLQMPTLSEQQKIANYLSNIDNKIKSVNNQITQTQTFKKGLLQQMFV